MKTIQKLLNNPVVLTYLLAAATCIHLISWGAWFALSKSDWGTWIGSVGTVGALLGTIYLARSERRRRERQELLSARMHGTLIKPRVSLAWSMIGSMRGRLHPTNADKDEQYFTDIAKQLDSIVLCTTEELVALSPHPTRVAGKLARAAGRIKSTAALVNTLPRMVSMGMQEAIPTNLTYLCNQLNEIEELLFDSIGDCMITEAELEQGAT